MSETIPSPSAVLSRLVWLAIGLIVVCAVLLIVAIGLDWGGFWGGAAQGAGIGGMIAGAYFWGFANGIRRQAPRAGWLPSRGAPQ